METDEPTKSKDDTKMTGDDMVWIKPEGPYTPDCPIGNPYCKYGYGDGAGWMCWKWAEPVRVRGKEPCLCVAATGVYIYVQIAHYVSRPAVSPEVR